MKKRFKIKIFLILILLLVLDGKVIKEINVNSFKNQSKPVISEAYSINSEISNENIEINEEINNEYVEDDDESNYLTLDVNEVKIPILMYHSISNDDPSNTLLVPINEFEDQIKWIKEENFTPMLLDDVLKAFNTGKVPEKVVAITFDDGYSDNYTEAYRILKEYNMKATFFIITDKIDTDGWYMNSDMLKEMSNNGMGIENHTSKHIEFTNISREEKIEIIKEGINKLKEKVGVDSKFICYPVGRYDEETIEVAKELDVQAAVTTENGVSSLGNGLHSLKRIRIAPMDIETFKIILSDF